MIDRYSRNEMKQYWTEENKFKQWLKVELAVMRGLQKEGVIPLSDFKKALKVGISLINDGINIQQINQLEKDLKHDVLAFTTLVAKKMGPSGRWFHFGLTSSDVVDTALSLSVQDAGVLLIEDLKILEKSLLKQSKKFKKLLTIGRTHGMFAEPTVFGLKFLSFYQEIKRSRFRIEVALESCRFGKLSGAVGASPHFSPELESKILKTMNLKREPVSTQVLPRDRLAELFCAFSILGSSLERIATEFRHLQRSEVAETREEFGTKQKGSSAMPHKRNPVGFENITGCARLLRSYVIAALENIPLWHERDISHSSVERVILPDAFILLDYAINRMSRLIDGLVVNERQVSKNLELAGQQVLSGHVLLSLVKKGVSREDAYVWLQKAAHMSVDSGRPWIDVLKNDKNILKYMSVEEVVAVASPEKIIKCAAKIYKYI